MKSLEGQGSSQRETREIQSPLRIYLLPFLGVREKFKCVNYIGEDERWIETSP